MPWFFRYLALVLGLVVVLIIHEPPCQLVCGLFGLPGCEAETARFQRFLELDENTDKVQ